MAALLEFPEHPRKSGAETDDDTQEQQGQGQGCEHGEHPWMEANGITANSGNDRHGGTLY
jgi:hypothetical protein